MTTTSSRTDIHRPVEMDPADYEYLFCFDNMETGRLIGVDMEWWRSITNFDPAMEGRGTHQCHHCGAHIRYVALLRHVPTGYAIAVGETCLDNRFELETKAEFDRLRKQAQLDRQQQRIKKAATALIESIGGHTGKALVKDADLETFHLEPGSWAFDTFSDIRRKMWQYGELSPKQIDLLNRIIREAPAKKAEKIARQAERDAEVECPAPVGRVEFSGVVVSRKWRDNDFGGAMKLTVKVTTDAGVYLVWVTEPSKSGGCEVGDTVTMTATLTPSNDKPNFAFGKRPSKFAVAQQRKSDLPSALD